MQLRGMNVEWTNHLVLPHGNDRMVLGDSDSGEALVLAERDGDGWTVSAPWGDAETVAADSRGAAITAMTDMALALGSEVGYSAFVPSYPGPDGTPVSLMDMP